MTVAPQSVDTIRGKALGASVAASASGYLLKLLCLVDGTWEVEINIGPWA
jgi:hypothetical protein